MINSYTACGLHFSHALVKRKYMVDELLIIRTEMHGCRWMDSLANQITPDVTMHKLLRELL